MDTIDARRYDRGMWFLERLSLTGLRRPLLAGARGAVLEIGAGGGHNALPGEAGVAVAALMGCGR